VKYLLAKDKIMSDVVGQILQIKLSDINADEDWNCRGHIPPSSVVELAKDIVEQGLIQPVTVAPQKEGKPYKLIAGYRRYLAHTINKTPTIKAIVNEEMADEDKATLFNLSENLQREDLTIMQEANAVSRLKKLGLNRQIIAAKLSKSPGWVQVRTMLLELPEPIQEAADAGLIKQAQIRELKTLNDWDPDKAMAAAKKMKEAKLTGRTYKSDKGSAEEKKRSTTPKPRNRAEVFQMMDHLSESCIGMGLWTRCLAWAAGEISDNEIYESFEEHAAGLGETYVRPSKVKI
jgi:ParB/RepB/Spo0J family partition protein